ncbi:Crp/Fnr family transcriptional regulator [Bradyrhizobium sp. 190]|uniref:Crp/Fnr family transcriptional regulator n=1 Tax=Bradyrhizobium sp. 190 TaxID=2782658 RepID=UPI001FFB63B5|nr:Crp/Fnr family transcriptional regulator [Bradyrhizobium sp. 190]MCK1518342.1 Crp/Fnr family transcriptional regulator [Bradyrhizobium sp. 190]
MNRFIASLPADARELLEKDLHVVQLKKGDVLYRIDEPITHVFFPHGGLVSLVVLMESGQTAEVSLIGREGLVCSGVVLGVEDAIDQATVEVGSPASCISSASFIRAYHSHDKLRTIVNRHHAMFIAEGRQSTACNAVHTASERLCRWLANAQDQSGMDDLEITQEFLARMVGVQRTTVNQLCGVLHAEGIIDTSRGHIRILQPEALRSRACECYGVLRKRFAKLFPDWRPDS